ncbi:hypothetical protein B484DRAFT_481233 [Ochromonadaceae sp. CCMP2298]|nr:hypothetical protein B484DRAFT_481233 [Ochromonadaceae sp. CCMP2298]
MNQDARIEKLQKKHDQEKAAALQEFSNFKSKMDQRDQKVASGFQAKYAATRAELEGMNRTFAERVDLFEATNKKLKSALEDSSKSGTAGMDELRAKYDEEIAELVRSSNEKYQNMLVQQLGMQTALRVEMEAKMEGLRAELAEQYGKDLAKELGRERASMGGDAQEALMALRRELEGQLESQRGRTAEEAARADAELRAKSEELAGVAAEGQRALGEVRGQMEDLKRSLSDSLGGSESRSAQLSKDLSSAQEELSTLQARVVQREEELGTVRAMLGEKNGRIVVLEDELAASQREALRLTSEVETSRSNGASNLNELTAKLSASQREAESFRSEINQIAAALATVRDELKRAERAAAKAALDAQKEVQELRGDKEMLNIKIQELRAQASAATGEMRGEFDKLGAEMEEAKVRAQRERLAALQEQEEMLSRVKGNHKLELEGVQARARGQLEEFEAARGAWETAREGREALLSADAEAAALEARRLLEEAAARSEAEGVSLKASLAAVQEQLQLLSEQTDSERLSLKAEVGRWEAKSKGFQKALDDRKKDGERAENVTNGLKNQVESLREELKASQKAFRELKASAESREGSMGAAHKAEVARLQALVEGTVAEWALRLAQGLEAAKAQAEEVLRNQVALLEGKGKREQLEALDSQARANAETAALVGGKFAAERALMEGRISQVQQEFVDFRQQMGALERVIEGERDERQRREEAFVLDRSQLQRAHETDIRREKESSERKIMEVLERSNVDISILKSEHLEVRGQYEVRISEVLGSYKTLERKYLDRESREADLGRILALEGEMVAKDELVVRTREEMQYFKREMLNREENYNQKFGSSPNVGVMQVLKTKEEKAKGKPTQMRMVNPSGGMGGVGGGLGGLGGVGGGLGGLGGGLGVGSSVKGSRK